MCTHTSHTHTQLQFCWSNRPVVWCLLGTVWSSYSTWLWGTSSPKMVPSDDDQSLVKVVAEKQITVAVWGCRLQIKTKHRDPQGWLWRWKHHWNLTPFSLFWLLICGYFWQKSISVYSMRRVVTYSRCCASASWICRWPQSTNRRAEPVETMLLANLQQHIFILLVSVSISTTGLLLLWGVFILMCCNYIYIQKNPCELNNVEELK